MATFSSITQVADHIPLHQALRCLIHCVSKKRGVEFLHFLNFYVSHGSATRFLRGGKKYYIYFVDNLLPFPTVKEFSKSVNI